MEETAKIETRVDSTISFKGLRIFNGVMGGLHLVQAIIMLVGGLLIINIKNFKLPITTDYLYFDDVLQRLVKAMPENIGNLPVGLIVSSFLFLSSIAHFLTILPGLNDFYNRSLEKNINYFRWFEYALSSSVMIVLIAMFFGVYDLGSLILIVGANATMNLMGLMMEKHNQTTEKTDWTSFIIGTFIGLIPWVIIAMYLFGNPGVENAPWFVWAILGAYFVFFWTFPINMILQYAKVGKWKDYLFGERGYIILSLVSKSLLAWLVFAGTLQPA
ncbi:MAG TPA: heliorhodopsin HeR [candidate division Zixibacteria bacterium]|nr:heliorhodopsin HeR [candidate division Zixibacteria bacterium]